MKSIYYWITMVLVTLSSYDDSEAAELGFEYGQRNTFFARPDNYSPATYSAVTLRFGDPYFIELIQAGWHGDEFARFTGAGIGYRAKGKWFAEGAVSAVHLTEGELMDQSGKWLALLTAGIGHRVDDNFSIILRMRHISNANTGDSNYGRDFVAIGPSIKF